MTFDKRIIRAALANKFNIVVSKRDVEAVYACTTDDLINSVYYIVSPSESGTQYKLTKYAAYNYTQECYFDTLRDLKAYIDKGLHFAL